MKYTEFKKKADARPAIRELDFSGSSKPVTAPKAPAFSNLLSVSQDTMKRVGAPAYGTNETRAATVVPLVGAAAATGAGTSALGTAAGAAALPAAGAAATTVAAAPHIERTVNNATGMAATKAFPYLLKWFLPRTATPAPAAPTADAAPDVQINSKPDVNITVDSTPNTTEPNQPPQQEPPKEQKPEEPGNQKPPAPKKPLPMWKKFLRYGLPILALDQLGVDISPVETVLKTPGRIIDTVGKLTGQSGDTGSPGVVDVVKSTFNTLKSDPNYQKLRTPEERAQAFIKRVKDVATVRGGLRSTLLGTEPVDAAFMDYSFGKDVYSAADKFIEAATPEDTRALQHLLAQAESDFGADSENFQKFKTYVTNGLKTKVWDAVKAEPLKNLPIAAALFLGQYSEGLANIMENPVAFYGSLLTMMLFGMRFVMSGAAPQYGDKEENINVQNYYNKVPYTR